MMQSSLVLAISQIKVVTKVAMEANSNNSMEIRDLGNNSTEIKDPDNNSTEIKDLNRQKSHLILHIFNLTVKVDIHKQLIPQ